MYAGFAAGLILMTMFSAAVPDIGIKFFDICKAFGMTLGLGTVMLCFCMFFRRISET